MKIALFGKSTQDKSYQIFQKIIDTLEEHASTIFIHHTLYAILENNIRLSSNIFCIDDISQIRNQVDYVFTIGGDGTFLDGLTWVRDSGIPMLGINIGRLGFLSSVNIDDFEEAIKLIKNKQFTLEKRSLLHFEPNIDGDISWALNDICIQRNCSSGLIKINVFVDDEHLNTYWSDGLIISTPTGSTAYSLGCGGPILTPDTKAFVLTPIASHTLTVRPIVIPDSSKIRINVDSRDKSFVLNFDSHTLSLSQEQELLISKEIFYINLIRLPNHSFYKTMKNKLMWGVDKRLDISENKNNH